MRDNIISIGTGSAGTGKSYLACRYAASELLVGNITKIVITRPYVAKYRDWETDRKSTRLNSSHSAKSRMPSSA